MNTQKLYYLFKIIISLIFLIAIPVLIFNYYLWNFLTKFYVITAVGFLLYRFTAWFYAEYKPSKDYGLSEEPYSLLIPVKDEDPRLFLNSVRSAIAQKGVKEILIGDDGSARKVEELLKKYPSLFCNVKLYRADKNIGKKIMQTHLIKKAKYDIIVSIDSDVVLGDEFTIQRLIAPLKNKKIGLSNGNLCIFDARKTLLNRVQSVMYYCANQIGRRSWGNLGFNPVASGQILAIRKSQFMPLLNEYLTKKFLGNKINFGEDRLMTNLLLREGYKSVYVELARTKSVGCETVAKYVKQQTRWRRSGIRESLFLLKFSRNPYLFTLVFSRLILPFIFTVLLATSLVYTFLTGYILYIPIIISILIFVTIVSDIPMIIEDYRRFPDLIVFSLFNVLVLSPLWVYALLTLDQTGWGTR
ncbi:MAG: glycosyltransferase [Nanoarchaeota archaeon]|nr:glycosyltransferase [Nanoarchaeota archaeon]MBU1974001.1 glycosyltransferase [Nanoarchaeota archaeon]